MAAQNMPAAEVEITVDLVRALLAEQFPALATLPLTLVANGWDNAIYRLGDDLLGADAAPATRCRSRRARAPLAPRIGAPLADPDRGARSRRASRRRLSVVVEHLPVVRRRRRRRRRTGRSEPRGTPPRRVRRRAAPAGTADAPFNEFRRGAPIAEFVPRIEANLATLEAAAAPVRTGSVPALTEFERGAWPPGRTVRRLGVGWPRPLAARRPAFGEHPRRATARSVR